ncbi:MAG: hypothetical protein JWM59_4096 [Verrucomicrobiales bacterium]|nr:hypothetical protein [Verrucomicrobiales bacterium]
MKSPLGTILLSISLSLPLHAAVMVTDIPGWESALPTTRRTFESFDSFQPFLVVQGDQFKLATGVSILGVGKGGLAAVGALGGDFPAPYINTDFEDTSTKLMFSFAQPVWGFGFDYVGADDGSSIWVTGDGFDPVGTAPNSPLGTPRFFGLVFDTPVSSFSLATNSSDQDYSIDNLRFAPVPEPVTSGYCAGTVLLCLLNRRRAVKRSSGQDRR